MAKTKRYLITIEIKTSKKRVAKLVEIALESFFKNFKILDTRIPGRTDEE